MEYESEELTIDDMRKDLQSWGIGLLLVGVVSIIFSGFLDPIWGVLLIVVGILTLAIKARGMFILIGILLTLAGIMNMFGGGGWLAFGVLQIYLGIMEFVKYGKYANVEEYY
jgi:hypothetical protein